VPDHRALHEHVTLRNRASDPPAPSLWRDAPAARQRARVARGTRLPGGRPVHRRGRGGGAEHGPVPRFRHRPRWESSWADAEHGEDFALGDLGLTSRPPAPVDVAARDLTALVQQSAEMAKASHGTSRTALDLFRWPEDQEADRAKDCEIGRSPPPRMEGGNFLEDSVRSVLPSHLRFRALSLRVFILPHLVGPSLIDRSDPRTLPRLAKHQDQLRRAPSRALAGGAYLRQVSQPVLRSSADLAVGERRPRTTLKLMGEGGFTLYSAIPSGGRPPGRWGNCGHGGGERRLAAGWVRVPTGIRVVDTRLEV